LTIFANFEVWNHSVFILERTGVPLIYFFILISLTFWLLWTCRILRVTLFGVGVIIFLCSITVLACIKQDDTRHTFGHSGGMCPMQVQIINLIGFWWIAKNFIIEQIAIFVASSYWRVFSLCQLIISKAARVK